VRLDALRQRFHACVALPALRALVASVSGGDGLAGVFTVDLPGERPSASVLRAGPGRLLRWLHYLSEYRMRALRFLCPFPKKQRRCFQLWQPEP
jgi:hypothetical protein